MHKVYLDTDVLLDVIAKRVPFYNHSALLLSKIDNKQISGFTTPLVLRI